MAHRASQSGGSDSVIYVCPQTLPVISQGDKQTENHGGLIPQLNELNRGPKLTNLRSLGSPPKGASQYGQLLRPPWHQGGVVRMPRGHRLPSRVQQMGR